MTEQALTDWQETKAILEAAMELRNDTGGAWFPDGHAGRFTQIEFQGSYIKQFGPVTVTTGGVWSGAGAAADAGGVTSRPAPRRSAGSANGSRRVVTATEPR